MAENNWHHPRKNRRNYGKRTPEDIPRKKLLKQLGQFVRDVSHWFVENALLLNPGKTEAVVLGTRQRLTTVDQACGLDVCGFTVPFSATPIKLLGVTLDSSTHRLIIDI
jgi:hypothetical protein